MFKKFFIGFMATVMIAQPAFAGKFGGGGGFRSSGSSFSSSRSFSSGSTYRPSTNYARPAAPAASPRFNNGSSYNYKPAQTRVVSRPTYSGGYSSGYRGGYYNRPIVNNHYYGGYGYYGGFGGGTFSSPWFWMWMMDRPHQQQVPVYVNAGGGQGMQQQYAQQGGDYAQPDNGGSLMTYIFVVVMQIIVIVLAVAFLIWILRKMFTKKRRFNY